MVWIVIEIAFVAFVAGLIVLYRKTIRPLHIIGNGMDLLKEQDFSSRLKHVGQKEADKIVDIFNKMMEQLKNERLRLREQNRFLDLLIASSPVGVVILDFDENILQVNPSGYQIFRLSSGMAGHRLAEFPPLGEKLAALEKGCSEIVRLNDSSIYKCTCSTFVESGFYHKFYIVEEMTGEVLKAEKKAYEKVIRTIAHEVNNSMAGISSTLETVRDIVEQPGTGVALDAGAPAGGENTADPGSVSGILAVASERCTSLSHFITNYADVVKIPEPLCASVAINAFFYSKIRFFEMLCAGKAIKIEFSLSGKDPVVPMDPVLMEQVLLNIVKNAIEAIGEAGGTVCITTFDNGEMEVADTGHGISPELAGKLFTPFFSTKPNGQGIGLIFIREVLQKHHFRFSLQTDAAGWTRFKIMPGNAGKMERRDANTLTCTNY